MVSMRDEFIEVFFKGGSLLEIMTHFSNSSSVQCVDPITTTVVMMLKNPIQCAVNEQGISPFKAHPVMTFPFSRMSTEQRNFVSRLQLVAEHSLVSVHSLMGGGRMHLFYEQEPAYYIPHTEALIEICKGCLSHPSYAAMERLQVCNIILQRVSALVNISNSTLKTVNEILRPVILSLKQ